MYMCDEIFWEWYLSLKMKFICFMYILFTQPENNLAHYFYSICALTKTHHVKSSIEFSICGVKLMPKKFWVLEQFGFQIFKLDTHSLYATLGLSSQYFSIAVEANYRELSGLKQCKLTILHLLGQKSGRDLTGLQSGCRQGCVPFWKL